ncbi:hypothetical protein B0I37DRAFT_381528 [Chaetomium sp. MPI-CAGE-AT-0009]|nr:hypothetical protein B0I37DRAFT_381528 [Chaetomium sp. MPI-CAGE-AT-0009]
MGSRVCGGGASNMKDARLSTAEVFKIPIPPLLCYASRRQLPVLEKTAAMPELASYTESETTLEWLGATTFRLRALGITIFLDAWLDKPDTVPSYIRIDDIDECDYILISHAHFDHLPGADRLARRCGSIIIGNGEAINVMRSAGVPEDQLIPVSGGERIPLFTAAQRRTAVEKAKAMMTVAGPQQGGQGPKGPAQPDPSTAPITLHAWPSLHCLMPAGNHDTFPDVLDSGTVYTGSASHACTLDVTRALRYGLGGLISLPQLPPDTPDAMKTFVAYLKDHDAHRCSFFDGGQIMYNILIGSKTILWNGHLGAYEGIMAHLRPQPDFAVLAIAGRPNFNGRPFDGSAAEFAVQEINWIGQPPRVVWCLHDQGPLKPFSVDTRAATELVHRNTSTQVVELGHGEIFKVFE